jgi:poly(beta-D-mannuronate) lyase
MSTRICWIVGFAAILAVSGARAEEYGVTSASDVERIASQAKPGDVLVMADGDWKDQIIHFKGKGTEENPITLRAQIPGKVRLVGESSILVEGDNLVVSGVSLDHSTGQGDGIVLRGDHNRLTESSVVQGKYKFFVHLFGSDNRVDHCYLAGKTTDQPTLQIEVEEKRPNHDTIDHNHFGPRPPLGRNGGETMRVGYSFQSMYSSGTLVEQNLYDRCDGEIEIISSKSCDNVYRGNTFLNCSGMLTLRHGNRCVVDGNFFIGNHKRGSGGIRVIGEDHLIVNNYMEAINNGAFWITAGIPDSPLKGYFRAQRCVIAFNTIVDSKGPYIQLDAGMGTSNRSLMPDNITIANNLFMLTKGEKLFTGEETQSYRWMGNIASGDGESPQHAGLKIAEVKLARGESGLLRPSIDSPVHGAVEGDFAKITTDIDGQPRSGKYDVGCDQILKAPIVNRPLNAADVGPAWMSVEDRAKSENIEKRKE